MKIARIVLTATMLLSLKSTLFCSSQEAVACCSSEEESVQGSIQATCSTAGDDTTDMIQAPRLESFDLPRDRSGFSKATFTKYFGKNQAQLAQETLDRCGQIEDGKEIRPGSNEESINFWDNNIQTLDQARRFKTATAKASSLSTRVSKKADDLIAAENLRIEDLHQAELQRIAAEMLAQQLADGLARQATIDESQNTFNFLQRQTRNELAAVATIAINRKDSDEALVERRQQEDEARQTRRFEQDSLRVDQLSQLSKKAAQLKESHNNLYPNNTIEDKAIITRSVRGKLAPTNLYAVANVFMRNSNNGNAQLTHTSSDGSCATASCATTACSESSYGPLMLSHSGPRRRAESANSDNSNAQLMHTSSGSSAIAIAATTDSK